MLNDQTRQRLLRIAERDDGVAPDDPIRESIIEDLQVMLMDYYVVSSLTDLSIADALELPIDVERFVSTLDEETIESWPDDLDDKVEKFTEELVSRDDFSEFLDEEALVYYLGWAALIEDVDALDSDRREYLLDMRETLESLEGFGL